MSAASRTQAPAGSADPVEQRVRRPSLRHWLSAFAVGLGVAVLSIALFGVSGRDDPYITFSAAEAIKDAGALVNINGDAVEQSTTLLFTVVLAVLSTILPLPVPLLGWGLGLAALASIVPLSYAVLSQGTSHPRALLGAVVVALTPPLMYWGTSGAEQSLGIALLIAVVLAMGQVSRSTSLVVWPLLSAGLAALVYLARPDYGLAVVAATFVLTVGSGVSARWRIARPLAITLLGQMVLLAAITGARLAFTGSPVPQPLRAKVGAGLLEQALRGLDYIVGNVASVWFLAIVACGIVAFWRTRHRPWTFMEVSLASIALVLIVGAIASGGDWMELGRFFAAPAALLTVLLMSRASGLTPRASTVVCVLVMTAQLGTMAIWSTAPGAVESRGSSMVSRWSLNAAGSPGVPDDLDSWFNAWNADHLGDAYFLGAALPEISRIMDTTPQRTLTITSGQGGMIPYYLRREFGDRIRFIDRFQLMTDDFNDCSLGSGPYGSFVSWNQWEALAGECAPALPDMVFSIGPFPEDDLGAEYEVVVSVTGSADRRDAKHPQEQWLAVRRTLLAGS